MLRGVYVVDNFYRDYSLVRKLALKAQYETSGPKAGYPGKNSIDLHVPHELFSHLKSISNSHYHLKLFSTSEYNSASCGRFRYALKSDNHAGGGIHVDYKGCLSAVVYLNTETQCQGKLGTHFWQHRATGSVRRNRAISDQDMEDPFQWDIWKSIPMVSNRCLIFDSQLYHSIHRNFGTSLADARLTQIFFIFPGHSRLGINCC
jgi:hypothetical protein